VTQHKCGEGAIGGRHCVIALSQQLYLAAHLGPWMCFRCPPKALRVSWCVREGSVPREGPILWEETAGEESHFITALKAVNYCSGTRPCLCLSQPTITSRLQSIWVQTCVYFSLFRNEPPPSYPVSASSKTNGTDSAHHDDVVQDLTDKCLV